MAKDPAFLFYSQDFITGTMFFTDDQAGKYIRLLCAQHQHGHLTLEQVNYICRTYDPTIMKKFVQDENGLYYNERLELETKKRKTFCDSRKANIKKRYYKKEDSTSVEHMYVHMENENENENVIKDKVKEKEKGVQGEKEKPSWAKDFKNYHEEIIYPFQYPEFASSWDLWYQFRREKRLSPYKPIGEQAALKRLAEFSSGNVSLAILIINQSIANNWQGFFELKHNGNNGKEFERAKSDAEFASLARVVKEFYGEV